MKKYIWMLIVVIACISSQVYSSEILFDGNTRTSGVKIVGDPEAPGNNVAHWVNAPKGYRLPILGKQKDLSKCTSLSMRFYSAQADNHGICILVDSNEAGARGNYFMAKFKVDWQGWKTVEIPFADFQSVRNPVGWNKVDKILMANSGYGGTKPNKEAEYYIDDLQGVGEKQVEADPEALTDADLTPAEEILFDGNTGISGVKLADDPENINNRVGHWVYAPKGYRLPILGKEEDLSDFNSLSIRFYSATADNHSFCFLIDSNEAGEKGNYYYKKIRINWKGWKTIVIPFSEFGSARNPAGWQKINKILLANNGYFGTKANPDAVYYIDDFKAVYNPSLSQASPVKNKAMDESKDGMMLFDGMMLASGVRLAGDPEKPDNSVAHWEGAKKGYRFPAMKKKRDLSAYKALSLKFYSESADKGLITVLIDSNGNREQKGNYFYKMFTVDWVGWKEIIIPFDEFFITRQPLGWQYIDSIMLANSGYGGAKPNPDAEYYIDDVKVLYKAPPPKKLKENESIELTSSSSSTAFQFTIDPSQENIYGIQYEIQGEPGAKVKLRKYKTWTEDNSPRQDVDITGHGWKPIASADWETRRIEFLTKKGAAKIFLAFTLSGEKPLKIRNVKVVKGGWPENPPLKESPYLDWIDSLESNLEYAANSPLLEFRKGGANIWNYKAGRVVYLSDDEENKFAAEVASYLKVSVKELISLMPEKRPFKYNSYCWGSKYDWDPLKPAEIRNKKTGELYNPLKEFPIQGYEKTVAPSGKTVSYAYHDTDKNHPKYKGQRIYVEHFRNDVVINSMNRAGTLMAMLYHKTGNMEYGVRSAAIFWAMARNMPDWPVTGKPVWNSPKVDIRLREPDYYSWFSFVVDGNWYVTNAGCMMWAARYFDIIRDTDSWKELQKYTDVEDPQKEAADGLLHIAKMILKRDAFHRFSEFVTFHNLSGSANRSLIQIGRVTGTPELVHYGMNKVAATFRKSFMADGIFPESQWYSGDQIIRQSQALDCLADYKDPVGLRCSLDGTNLNIKDPTESISTYGKIMQAFYRQAFPNGNASTVHDSWSETSNPTNKSYSLKFPERENVTSYLYNAYGHGTLGRGSKPARIEGQLHFGGYFNHGHRDLLNLNIWAYGDELVSDIGYTHITQYHGSSLSHNLVVVDKSNQGKVSAKGNLQTWNARKGATQVVQAEQGKSRVYAGCDIYRRSLFLLPFGNDNNVVFDIFEVKGGNRHDWMARGCLDYKQLISTDLVPGKTLDNLAENGIPVEDPFPWGSTPDKKYTQEKVGEPSIFYGAIRNAAISANNKPWQVTMKPTPPVPANTAWAGERAKSPEPKPSMRLHWLAPLDGKAMLAESPRNRYENELQHKKEASEVWSKNRAKQIIVSREGKDLKSTFVALWEPFTDKPFLGKIEKIDGLKEGESGWRMTDGKITKTVLYKSPESQNAIKAAGITSDAGFVVKSEIGNTKTYDVYKGTFINTGKIKADLKEPVSLPVKNMLCEAGKYEIEVNGSILGEKNSITYDNEYICFNQEGHPNNWLKLSRIIDNGSSSRIVLAEDPGFTYDQAKQVLRETYFPHHISQGKAEVILPAWLNLKTQAGNKETLVQIRASNSLNLKLEDIAKPVKKIQIKGRNDHNSWKDISFKKDMRNNVVSMYIKAETVDDQWLNIRIQY